MTTALTLPPDVTVRQLDHRFLEKVGNLACGVSERLGLPFTNLRTEALQAAARRRTGLGDFGDPRYLEPMGKLIEQVTDFTRYTPLARAFIRTVCVRALAHRLQIEQFFKDHPEAADIPIEAPIFVLGFPRTGTTVLQNLLEQPPHRRALQFWETTSPIPWEADLERDRAARIKRSDRDLSLAYRVVPEMAEMHAVSSTTAEECWPLISNTFAVVNYDICHGLEPYGRWLMGYDMTWAYAEYRRMLQMLLWRLPAKQLVLKCPEHLWELEPLLRVFPDACIVWTHREPFDCIASYSSMISLSRRTLQGRIDPRVIGPHITDRFHVGVTRAMAARDALGDESRFFDVDFYDLVRDRVGMVGRIEQHFGLQPTDPALLQDWLANKRSDSRGSHRYDPAMWGLDREDIHARFAPYIERFGITLQPPADGED